MALGGQVNKVVNYTFRLNGAGQARTGMANIGKAAVGLATAAVGAGAALFALIDRITRAPAAIQDMSNRTGIAAQTLAELGYIAEQDGASLESLQTGIRTMSSAIIDANAGLATYQRSFEQLGVDYARLATLEPQEAFYELSDAISQLEDDTLRMSVAQDIFGRGGMMLIPTLDRGAEGLREMAAEAHELGIVLDEDAYAKSKQFQDALTEMRAELSGVLIDSVIPMLPAIKEMAGVFLDAAVTVIPKLITALDSAVPVIMAVVKAVMAVVDVVILAAEGLAKLSGQDNLSAWTAIQTEAHQTALTVDQVTAALDRMYAAWPGLRPGGSVEGSVEGSVFGGDELPSIFNQMPGSGTELVGESSGGGGPPLTPFVKDAKTLLELSLEIKAVWEDMGKDAITGDVLRVQEEKSAAISESLRLQEERSRQISDLLTNGARDFVQTLMTGGDDWGEKMIGLIAEMGLKFAAMQIGGPIGGFLGAFL